MLFTLILSIAAGVAVPAALPKVRELLGRVVPEEHMPDAAGQQVATFVLLLLAAAVLLQLIGAHPSPVLMLLGGFIGAFQAEIRAVISDRMG